MTVKTTVSSSSWRQQLEPLGQPGPMMTQVIASSPGGVAASGLLESLLAELAPMDQRAATEDLSASQQNPSVPVLPTALTTPQLAHGAEWVVTPAPLRAEEFLLHAAPPTERTSPLSRRSAPTLQPSPLRQRAYTTANHQLLANRVFSKLWSSDSCGESESEGEGVSRSSQGSEEKSVEGVDGDNDLSANSGDDQAEVHNMRSTTRSTQRITSRPAACQNEAHSGGQNTSRSRVHTAKQHGKRKISQPHTTSKSKRRPKQFRNRQVEGGEIQPNESASDPPGRFVFTDEHDITVLCELLGENGLFSNTGDSWTSIYDRLQSLGITATKQSVKNRISRLAKSYTDRQSVRDHSAEQDQPPESEIDSLLREYIQRSEDRRAQRAENRARQEQDDCINAAGGQQIREAAMTTISADPAGFRNGRGPSSARVLRDHSERVNARHADEMALRRDELEPKRQRAQAKLQLQRELKEKELIMLHELEMERLKVDVDYKRQKLADHRQMHTDIMALQTRALGVLRWVGYEGEDHQGGNSPASETP